MRSRLWVDGTPTRVKVPGYNLIGQCELAAGQLLVTDLDCPFDETTFFLLLSPRWRVRSCTSLRHLLVRSVVPVGPDEVEVSFFGDRHLPRRLGLRRHSIPFLLPKLAWRATPPAGPAGAP